MIETAEQVPVATQQPEDESFVGRQTAIGGTWMVSARLISRVIDLCTMLVLAHILSPKDFGLVAIAMTVILIVEAALELPVSQALIRLTHTNPDHYDTAFTLGVLRGLILTVTICGVSWPFARFYGDTRLLPLVMLLSLAPAARGVVSPRLADFARSLKFSPDFTMEFTGKLIAFLTAVTIAITLRSYWAIAAGTIVSPIAATVTSYIIAPYRPKFGLKELPSFSGFIGWFTAAQVVSAVNWQIDRLLLGKLVSRTELGLFSVANDSSNIPVQALLNPVLRPLMAAFSLLRENSKRIKNSYQTSATVIVTLGLPILVGESLLAYPLIRLMGGEKWIGAAPLVRWLALSIIPTLFAVPMGPLAMAYSKTEIFFKRNLFELCIKVPLVVVGAIRWHFMGVVYARCISETVTVCFCMVVVRNLIGLPIRAQLLNPWRSIVSVAGMAGVVALAMPHLPAGNAVLPLAIGTGAIIALGAAVYIALLWILWTVTGKPAGIEAMISNRIDEFSKRNTRYTAPELS